MLRPSSVRRRLASVAVALAIATHAPVHAADPADDLARGISLLNDGDYGQAIIVLDATARRLDERGKRPDAARAYFHLGTAYVAENQERLAVSAFRQALERDEKMELSAFDVSPRVREMFERARRERDQDRLSAKKGGGGSKALLVVGGLLAAGGGAAAALSGGGDGGGSTEPQNPVCAGAGVTLTGSSIPVGSTVTTSDTTTLTFNVVPDRRNTTTQSLEISLGAPTGEDCYNLGPVPVSTTNCVAATVNLPLAFAQFATRCRLPFSISQGRWALNFTSPDGGSPRTAGTLTGVSFNVAR